jgi:tetratricopeptide (TPR) repeat protein
MRGRGTWAEYYHQAVEATRSFEFERAETFLKDALRLADEANVTMGEREVLLWHHSNVLELRGDPSAVGSYQQLLVLQESIHGLSSREVACTLVDLAEVQLQQKDWQGAEEHLKRAIDILQDIVPTDSAMIAQAVGALSEACRMQGCFAVAEYYACRAFELTAQTCGTGSAFLASSLTNRALAREALGDVAGAATDIARARELRRSFRMESK